MKNLFDSDLSLKILTEISKTEKKICFLNCEKKKFFSQNSKEKS